MALALLAFGAPQAHAAGYRYWSYWLGAGHTWTYAQSGPAVRVPRDGDVEGWRFAVSQDAADRAERPRGEPSFAAVCGHTPAVAGRKRVALVIDPGTPADAPGGGAVPAERTACAQVAGDASSADALASVARPLRYDSSGILCAIGGYPVRGCGEQVSAGGGRAAGDGKGEVGGGKGGGPSVGVLAGAGAVVVLGGAAWWRSRRRRS